MKLTNEIKAQLIADIEKGDEAALRGMMETLKICLGDSSDPNEVRVSFTYPELNYLEKWSAAMPMMDVSGIIRLLVDMMMKVKPDPTNAVRDEAAKQIAKGMRKG